jgi:hypothetical protein
MCNLGDMFTQLVVDDEEILHLQKLNCAFSWLWLGYRSETARLCFDTEHRASKRVRWRDPDKLVWKERFQDWL